MKKTSTPKAFNIYFDTFEHIEMLTMEQRGELFTALYEYAINERATEFDNGMVRMAFSFMKAQIARDFEKYREKCEANRANASGRKRSLPNANDGSQKEEKEEEKEEKEKNKEKEEYKEEEKENKKEKYKEEEKENKKEEEKEDLNNSLSDPLSSRIDYDHILDSFNRICGCVFAIDTMTDKRKAAVDNAAEILGATTFEELFERVGASDFLSGRNGKWYGCNFDWILKPENLQKILSGAYDNPMPKPAPRNDTYSEYKPFRSTSYDIEELKKIDTLDFMDEPGWQEKVFGHKEEEKTGWDVPF